MNVIDFLRKNSKWNKEDYFADSRIGHSDVVNFEKYGPKGLLTECKATKAMNFGSLVDCLLFTPEVFNNEFYICNFDDVLSEKQLELYNIFNENLFDSGLPVYFSNRSEESDNFILSTCRLNKIYASFKDDTVLQKVYNLFESFRKFQGNSSKISITADDYNQAVNIVNILKTGELTKKLFTNFKAFYQVKMTKGNVRTLHDMILVDEKNHKIIPFDLKVTQSPESEWVENSFYKFRYYRQAEMYQDVLRWCISNCDDCDLWEIDDFKFLVVSAQNSVPMIFNFPIKYNEEGNLVISKKGASVPKYIEIVNKIEWHRTNREFNYPENIINDIYSKQNTNQITYINIID